MFVGLQWLTPSVTGSHHDTKDDGGADRLSSDLLRLEATDTSGFEGNDVVDR